MSTRTSFRDLKTLVERALMASGASFENAGSMAEATVAAEASGGVLTVSPTFPPTASTCASARSKVVPSRQ